MKYKLEVVIIIIFLISCSSKITKFSSDYNNEKFVYSADVSVKNNFNPHFYKTARIILSDCNFDMRQLIRDRFIVAFHKKNIAIPISGHNVDMDIIISIPIEHCGTDKFRREQGYFYSRNISVRALPRNELHQSYLWIITINNFRNIESMSRTDYVMKILEIIDLKLLKIL